MTEVDENLISIADQDDPEFRWTVKRRRFAYYVAKTGKVDEARKLAGFATEGAGTGLLALQPIRTAVQAYLRQFLEAEGETSESVVARWARWANVDPGDFFQEGRGWELKDINDLTESQRKCIKKVTIREHQHGRDLNIEFHDAAKANNDLATSMGLLGRQDEGDKPPEEAAKAIRAMLQEMDEVDGLQEPGMEGNGSAGTPTTH